MFILRNKTEIICKSYMRDADTVALRFTAKADLDQQHDIYCCENYRYCETYLCYRHFHWLDD